MKHSLTFSICMPVYKGSHVLRSTLMSILNQKNVVFELIIVDDNSPSDLDEIEETQQIIRSFADKRIRYFKNKKNLGYPQSMDFLLKKTTRDVVFLMGQDDILAVGALKKTHDGFFLDKDVGAVTRPYFWFYKDSAKPVRAISPPCSHKAVSLSLKDNPERVFPQIIESIGQLSGLAMRREYINLPMHPSHVFTCHVYPFLSILKTHNVVYLNDMTVAVRIEESQSRHVSAIYNISPTDQWFELFNTVFPEGEFERIRTMGKNMIAQNYIGLIQLKNYANSKVLPREILKLIQYRPANIYHPVFLIICMITLCTPKILLRRMTDSYKEWVLSKIISSINFYPQN